MKPLAPVSSLAAAMALHGAPSKKMLEMVLESMREGSIDPESINFGPAYERACRQYEESTKVLARLIKLL